MNNKLKLTIIALLISAGVFAQFQQGTKMAGGSFSLSTITEKSKFDGITETEGRSTSINVGPEVGWFVTDHLALGAGLNLSYTGFNAESGGGKINSSGISIAPFVRYYFDKGIFLQARFGAGSSKVKYKPMNNPESEEKYSITLWSLGAGYAIFLNESVAIEPMINYGSTSMKDEESSSKNISSGLTVSVGFQIYLNRN